jgi:hypothetical protein
MKIHIFGIQDKAKPYAESKRLLNLMAVKRTTFEVIKLSLWSELHLISHKCCTDPGLKEARHLTRLPVRTSICSVTRNFTKGIAVVSRLY